MIQLIQSLCQNNQIQIQIRALALVALSVILTACAASSESTETSATSSSKEALSYPRGFDERSLEFLECPINGMKFRLATENQLANLNQAIEDLSLGDLKGSPIRGYLHGIIIRTDGKVAYRVKDGAPILSEADAIDLVNTAKSDPDKFNNMGRR